MAKYDVVKIKGKNWLALSNEQSVGVGGRNEKGDVMLIQAMLRYIAPFQKEDTRPPVVPELTGMFDTATGEAIRHFQRTYSFRLIQADGVIHPPSYITRTGVRDLKNPFKPLMTHTFLHLMCRNFAQLYAHARYPDGITLLMPQLLPFLKSPGFKTLSFVA